MLMSCNGHGSVGALRIEPPPASISAPCARPESYLGAGDWELVAVRIGDALIECALKQAALVARDKAIRVAITEVAQ